MSGLTKEQLKNELINHGVELPSSSARKGEYVQLYEKYVAPVQQSKGDFSSDEEDLPNSLPMLKKASDSSFVIDGLDISKISDDELFGRLQNLGATVGPIVGTTRKVYQKKLYVLMGGAVEETSAYNGDVDQDEYSDSEEEVVEEPQKVNLSTSQRSAPVSPPQTDIRKRILVNSGSVKSNQDDLVFDPDRHTPSPRRSLRTVTSTSTESFSLRKTVGNERSGVLREKRVDSVHQEEVAGGSSKLAVIARLLVKLILLALILVGILFAYQYLQNNPTESPFKAVEQLARQALEAAVGEEESAEKTKEPLPSEEPIPPVES